MFVELCCGARMKREQRKPMEEQSLLPMRVGEYRVCKVLGRRQGSRVRPIAGARQLSDGEGIFLKA